MTMTTETTTTDQLHRMVESIRDDLRAMDAGDWPADMDPNDYDDESDPFGAWLGDQLDVVTLGLRHNGAIDWDATAAEVSVTLGGPDIRVTFRFGDGLATIAGRWGTDRASREVYVDNLTDRLEALLNA